MLSDLLLVVQIVVLLAGIASLFVALGRRDQSLRTVDRDLSELGGISRDLVKSVVGLGATQKHHDEKLTELSRRIERLESRR